MVQGFEAPRGFIERPEQYGNGLDHRFDIVDMFVNSHNDSPRSTPDLSHYSKPTKGFYYISIKKTLSNADPVPSAALSLTKICLFTFPRSWAWAVTGQLR